MNNRFANKDYLVVLTVCAAALALAVVFTGNMTPSFDSVRYANVAHWIAEGEGIVTSLTVVPVQENTATNDRNLHAFTIQPPGLPIFYAATGVGNRIAAHRALHIASYLALAGLVLLLGQKLTGRLDVGATAALLTILSPSLLLTAGNFWTDLPTVTLLLGALYCLIRSRERGPRAWAWLIAASVLSACAVSFRLTALAFGAVLLTDIVLNRRLPIKAQLLRVLAGSGIFGGVTLWLFVRNKILAGAISGTAPHTWPMAPEYSLTRGWSYLGSRLMQSLTPSWAVDGVGQKLAQANGGPDTWSVPGVLLLVAIITIGLGFALRRTGRLAAWPAAAGNPIPAGTRTLTLSLFFASLLLLLIPAGRHAEFGVVEFRYVISLLPFLWIAIAAVVMSTNRRVINLVLGAVLVAVFVVGVPSQYRPYRHSHEFMRTGLDWIKLAVPADTAMLSNGGKVLLDEDLTRNVYHISDWNFRHAFGPEMQTERGFLDYLQQHDIRYVALFGNPGRRQAAFWGRPVIGLFLEQWWQPWLAYGDKSVKVYRIPASGPPPAQP